MRIGSHRYTDADDPFDLDSIRLHDPGYFVTGDPYRAWQQLRDRAPVRWFETGDGRGYWVITRYPDATRVLRDFQTFTSTRGNILTMLGSPDAAGGKMLPVTDPPKHTAIKRQIAAHFTASATRAFEPAVRELARRVIAPAAGGDAIDFAAATAVYPIAFTALLMGIQRRDWTRLMRFANVAIADQDADVRGDIDAAEALARAHSEIFAYFMEELAQERPDRDDVTAAIARAELPSRPLTDEEKIYNLYSILLGATVTTSHAMNAAVCAFADDPSQLERWQQSGATATLVEEVLRWSSPANHVLRHATQDTEFGGLQIRQGDPVTAWLGSANHDEAVFDHPDVFDPYREPNRHIAFGVGAHRCIGAPMARLALEIFFDEIRQHVRRFVLAGPVDHLASNFIAGIKRLPLYVELRAESVGQFRPLPALVVPPG